MRCRVVRLPEIRAVSLPEPPAAVLKEEDQAHEIGLGAAPVGEEMADDADLLEWEAPALGCPVSDEYRVDDVVLGVRSDQDTRIRPQGRSRDMYGLDCYFHLAFAFLLAQGQSISLSLRVTWRIGNRPSRY